MGRHETYYDEDLVKILENIQKEFGDISIANIQEAHKKNPETVPSYKTFERRMKGLRHYRYLPELMTDQFGEGFST